MHEDEARKRVADLNAVDAIVELFDHAPHDKARMYAAAAISQLALSSTHSFL